MQTHCGHTNQVLNKHVLDYCNYTSTSRRDENKVSAKEIQCVKHVLRLAQIKTKGKAMQNKTYLFHVK